MRHEVVAREHRQRPAAVVLALVLLACASSSQPPGPLRLAAAPAGPDTRLTLVAAPGVRLNARIKPALELRDGTILRFDSPHRTPDSTYFASPPTALLAGVRPRLAGTLRASICTEAELVCRSVTLEL